VKIWNGKIWKENLTTKISVTEKSGPEKFLKSGIKSGIIF
jgi:hypothetical protein